MKYALISKCGGTGGVPRYAKELRTRIPNLTHYKYNCQDAVKTNSVVTWQKPRSPAGFAVGKFLFAPKKVAKINADVYHALDPTEASVISLSGQGPVIATLHDLVAYTIRRYRNHDKVKLARSRAYLKTLDRICDTIITVSHSTKEDAAEILDIPLENMSVVYPGIDSQFRPIDESDIDCQLNNPSILMVGDARKRKNHESVIKSISKVHREGPLADLLIVGSISDSRKMELSSLSAEYGVSKSVKFEGRVSDRRLVELYNCADVLAMPSFYEGFGFPVVEAMACGTPVVTSNVSSLPEVAGEAAIKVNPNDPGEIADGLLRVLTNSDLTQMLSERGMERAKNFSWSKSIDATEEIYKNVINY